MKSQMWVVRMVPVASAIVMAAAPVAFAQYGQYGSGSELFEWNGRVDREVQVVMRGNQIWTNQIGQTEGRGLAARDPAFRADRRSAASRW